MALAVDRQTEKSLRSGLGLQGSLAMNSGTAVLLLQLNADWWHEFQDHQRLIRARFAQDLRADPVRFGYQNQPPDRDVFTARLSLAVTMPHGFSAFASVDGLFGHSYLDRYGAALGLRKEL
jgi:outer membrane autotransporter protein